MAAEKKPFFPLFIDLSEKKVYVVGAGTIAKRRIRSLIPFTSSLTVIAPEVNPELLTLEAEGAISICKKRFELEDIADADIVLAATNDHPLNDLIYQFCKERGIFVNVCSDKVKCDFYFPGIARKDEIVVGVTAGGSNHKRAKQITDAIKEML